MKINKRKEKLVNLPTAGRIKEILAHTAPFFCDVNPADIFCLISCVLSLVPPPLLC